MFYWSTTVGVCKKKKKLSVVYTVCIWPTKVFVWKFLCSMYTFFREFIQFSYNYGGGGGGGWNYFSSFVFSVGNESLTCQDGGPSR